MLTRIEITEEDFRNGRRSECNRCPGALAINRVLIPEAHSYVGWTTVRFLHPNLESHPNLNPDYSKSFAVEDTIPTRTTPPELQLFIRRFDGARTPTNKPYLWESLQESGLTVFYLDIPADLALSVGD